MSKLLNLNAIEEIKKYLDGIVPLYYAGLESTQEEDLAVLTKAYQEFKKTGRLIPVYHVYSDEPTGGSSFMNNKGPRLYWLTLINYNTTGGFSTSVSNATFLFSCLRIPNTEYDLDSTWVTKLRWSGFSVECYINKNHEVTSFASSFSNASARREENIAFESTVTALSDQVAALPTKDYVDSAVSGLGFSTDGYYSKAEVDNMIAELQASITATKEEINSELETIIYGGE